MPELATAPATVSTQLSMEDTQKQNLAMLETMIRNLHEQQAKLPVTAQENPIVKECVKEVTTATQKLTQRQTVLLELESAASVLRDANLLTKRNRWVNGFEPNQNELSPELKRAVARFNDAKKAAKELPKEEADMNLSMRSLRTAVRIGLEPNVILALLLAVGPILAAIDVFHCAQEGLNNTLADVMEDVELLNEGLSADTTEAELTDDEKQLEAVKEAEKTPDAAALDDEEEESLTSSPRELASAMMEASQKSANLAQTAKVAQSASM